MNVNILKDIDDLIKINREAYERYQIRSFKLEARKLYMIKSRILSKDYEYLSIDEAIVCNSRA